MLAPTLPLVGALLLAQPGSEAPVLQPPSFPLPALTWGAPTACLMLPPTQHVPSGAWRAQCDDDAQRCRVAPVRELGADGVETDRPVARATHCSVSFDEETAERVKTYRMEPARADAPPGWYRDERGRVMQFNFDLNRRVWLGGAWAPMSHDGQVMHRMRADFGIAVEVPTRGDKTLHRLRFLETELHLGVHSLDLTLARYDFSIQREDPLLRVTTFLGKPRRHDLYLNMGLWMEALHLEQLKRDGQVARFLSLGAVQASVDLWHSRDLVSYVRVRAGTGVESDLVHGFNAVAPSAALEGDVTLDPDGFHHFRMSAEVETLLLAPRVEGRPRRPERLRVQAGYEVILLAINDQPLSLLVDGRGVRRDDIAGVPERWEWSASAGLRFSLWAPARRSAPIAVAARE